MIASSRYSRGGYLLFNHSSSFRLYRGCLKELNFECHPPCRHLYHICNLFGSYAKWQFISSETLFIVKQWYRNNISEHIIFHRLYMIIQIPLPFSLFPTSEFIFLFPNLPSTYWMSPSYATPSLASPPQPPPPLLETKGNECSHLTLIIELKIHFPARAGGFSLFLT